MTRHSAQTRAAAVAAYAAGESADRVAARFGASGPTVLGWVRAAGVPVRHGGRTRFTAAEVAQWVVEYMAGDSCQTIAARHGTGHSAVRRHLLEAGVTMSGRTRRRRAVGPSTPEQVDAWVAEYTAGDSLETIAARHGVTPYIVSRRLRSAGVEVSPVRRSRISEAQVDVWVAEYEAGASIARIAAAAAVANRTVWLRLRARGVNTSGSRPTPDDRQESK